MKKNEISFAFFKLQNFIFFEGVKQIANVTALSWIVGKSVGLPDILSGYGNYVIYSYYYQEFVYAKVYL